MDTAVFESNPELLEIIARVKTNLAGKVYSDIVDDAGNQYIDLVMEGGGMLGIALVGYIYVLEAAGLRFMGIGGTSAGSITALMLAALDEPAYPKSKKLIEVLASKNFYDFVDGGYYTRSFIETGLKHESIKKNGNFFQKFFHNLKLYPLVIFAVIKVWCFWGLNPGKAFKTWIEETLEVNGIKSTEDLETRMHKIPKGLRVDRRDPDVEIEFITTQKRFCSKLAIITSDVATESKIEFPEMANLYWPNPAGVNPSEFVRASMSIPLFFRPHVVEDIPKGSGAEDNWKKVGYKTNAEGVPDKGVFIDGGIMSNFPIDIFHTPNKVPEAPTFGVKLELDKRRHKIEGIPTLLWAIFNSARHTLDYDFIYKNPDYEELVEYIPATNYNWLDFNMSETNRLNLFLEGARFAERFLTKFNWPGYKKLREAVLEQHRESVNLKTSKAPAIKILDAIYKPEDS